MTSAEYAFRTSQGTVGPRDDRPLTEEEQKLVARLFSDPIAFPIDFKQWLVSFIESSEMTLPMATIAGLTNALGIGVVGGVGLANMPAGLVFPYGGDTPPGGALICNGQAYSRETRKKLFDVIGVKFGAPDGLTFNVPDLRKRVATGFDASQIEFNQIGKSGGAIAHALTIPEMPSHDHELTWWDSGTDMPGPLVGKLLGPNTLRTASDTAHNDVGGSIEHRGGGAAHNNLQPYLTFNFIITHG